MNSLSVCAITGLLIANLSTLAHAAKLEDIAPYPKAEAGFTRQVIHLPKQEQEENFQVEILAGKTLEVDCNRQRLGGVLDEKNLQGWGYPFYRLEKVVGPMSTMMACPPGSKKKRAIASGRRRTKSAPPCRNNRSPALDYLPRQICDRSLPVTRFRSLCQSVARHR